MFKISEDIHSLTEFKRHTSIYVKQIKNRRRPMVLTVNGKAAIIVQDADSYQKLMELAEKYEAISLIKEGMGQSNRGKVISFEKFDKKFRKKYGLSR